MDWSKRAPHHFRPASGIPAKGASIHGGANGYVKKPALGPEILLANHSFKLCERDTKGRMVPLPKTAENQARAERALAKAVEIMEAEDTDRHTQLAAANSIQNRVWGAPVQPNVQADMSILDLVNASMKPKDASAG